MKQEAEVNVELEKYIRRTHAQALWMVIKPSTSSRLRSAGQCKPTWAAEDSLLEVLGGIEALRAKAGSLEQERMPWDQGRLHALWVREGRLIRAELEDLWPKRQAAAEELSRDMMSRYTGFRERGLVPVSHLGGKVCTACHVVVRTDATRGLQWSTHPQLSWLRTMAAPADSELDPSESNRFRGFENN